MTFGPITINRPGATATVGIMGPIGKTGAAGKDGSVGPQGPAVFTPIAAWVSGETYSPATATSPASFVSINGGSYACTTLHTSGIFTTDLAAGLWEPVGSKGDQGASGTPGSTWYEGSSAPTTSVGINGDYFLRTDTYDVLIKVSGAWSTIGNLKGVAGNTIQNGTGAPSSSVGNNGDFYLDTTASAPRLYGPKAGGAWPSSGISLIGSGAGNVNPTGTFTAGNIVAAATSDGKTIEDTGLSFSLGAAPLVNGTAAVGSASTLARSDHVHPTDASRAPLASPALTGMPTAPTAAAKDASTRIATTAYTDAAVAAGLSSVSTFPVSGIVAKSAAYSIVAADKGTMFDLTGSFGLTLPAVSGASPSAPLYYHFRKRDGSGICTLPCSGSDTFANGRTSVSIYQEFVTVVSFGGPWYFPPGGRQNRADGGVYSIGSGLSALQINFPFGDGEARGVEIDFEDVTTSTSASITFALLQAGTAGTMEGQAITGSSSTTSTAALSGSSSTIGPTVTATAPVQGTMSLRNIQSAAARGIVFAVEFAGAGSTRRAVGQLSTTGALSGVSLTASTGTLSGGTYHCEIVRA